MKRIAYFLLIQFAVLSSTGQKAVIYHPLNDNLKPVPVNYREAESLFQVFKNSKAFDWTDWKNNCEDRAAAVCLILDRWNIDNGKIWIYRGKKLKDKRFKGNLNRWNYHVASCIFVSNETTIDTLVIDPLVSPRLISANQWVEKVAAKPVNIYFITSNQKYQQKKIALDPEWKLTADNTERIIEGLTRYSSGSLLHRIRTKKYLKRRYTAVKSEFYKLYHSNYDETSMGPPVGGSQENDRSAGYMSHR